MKLGAQLYTLREFCKDTKGLEEAICRVAKMGYVTVQLSGVCPYDPAWMKKVLDFYSLTADITHFAADKIANDTKKVIEHHDILSCKHIGIGSNPFGATPEGLEKLLAFLGPAPRLIKESGHRFMYHNHNAEFAKFGQKTYLELLCEAFDPLECGITFDAYWAQAAGCDPAHEIRRLAGRVDCVHLKDMVYSEKDKGVRMAPVGKGNMNYPEIIKACADAGVSLVYVEQDNCYESDPFDCLEQSYNYLKGMIHDT